MQRIWAALLLAAVAGFASGCGGSSSSGAFTPSRTDSLTVSSTGTRGFVTVGSTGISLFVPENAVFQTTTFTVSPFDRPVPGFPLTGGDRFISGLTFQGFIDLGRPAELRIPVFTTTPFPFGAVIAVFQQTPAGFVEIPVTSFGNGIVTFQTATPGTFVVVVRNV